MIELDSALHANQSIIPRIYEAAARSDQWDDVMARVAGFFGHPIGFISIGFLASGRGETLGSVGLSPDYVDIWREKYGVNAWTYLALQTPPGEVIHAAEAVPVEALLDSPFGREMVAPLGVQDGMGVRLNDSPLVVMAFSSYSTGPFDPKALDLLEFVGPHLARAVSLHQRFSELQTREDAFNRGLEGLGAGIFLLRPSGEVLYQNATARDLLDQTDGLTAREERLVLERPEDGAALEQAIDQALSPRPDTPRRGFLRIQRPSGHRAFHAVVSPVAPTLIDPGREPAVLLWVTDPEASPVPNEEAIGALLGLTPAESRIAAAICAGQSVRDHAAQAGIQESTARWTLKQVLAKTDTHTQAELVQLVLGSIPSPPY